MTTEEGYPSIDTLYTAQERAAAQELPAHLREILPDGWRLSIYWIGADGARLCFWLSNGHAARRYTFSVLERSLYVPGQEAFECLVLQRLIDALNGVTV